MKEKANFEAPFVALILILAGTLSPSNGVDDASYKSPSELIGVVFRVLTIGVAVYLLWTFAEDQKKYGKKITRKTPENAEFPEAHESDFTEKPVK